MKIDDLLLKFQLEELTVDVYMREKTRLEARFKELFGVCATEINARIRDHSLPCTYFLVAEWISLTAMEPYIDFQTPMEVDNDA